MVVTVLHEDANVVVVDKAAGLLVHNSAWAGPRETTLTDLVRERFPDAVPIHRLDRQTSGCVLFAKNSAQASSAQEALSAASKQYLALVRGHLAEAVDVDHAFRDDDDASDAAPKEARSRIAPLLLSSVDRCSVVVVTLFTGRRHQARRHCKHINHPVIGDATHGKGSLNREYKAKYGVARMALHAWRLDLGGVVVVEAPLPVDLRAPLALLFPGVDVDAAARLALSPP